MQKKILIFGISSFVGSGLAHYLSRYYRVMGTYFDTDTKIAGVQTVYCDILNRDLIQKIIYTYRPDYTIYTIGLSSIENCYKELKLADILNTGGVVNVLTFTERYGSRFIFFSSAYAFSGLKRDFFESDTPDSNTSYGKTVAATEFYVQKSCLNYLILRCGRFYGASFNPRQTTWFEMLQKKIYLNAPLVLDDLVVLSFIDIDFLGVAVRLCIENDISNKLLNFSSRGGLSFYEFAKLYADVFQQGMPNFIKGSWFFPETKMDYGNDQGPLRYYQLKLDNIEMYLGIELPNIRESLEYTFKKYGGSDTSGEKGRSTGVQFI